MGNVKGSKDGLQECNAINKKVGALIGPEELKRDYLFGIDIRDKAGNPLSDATYQTYIDNAVSMLEHDLDIHITPTCIVEDKDYRLNDYADWGYMYLNNYPVIELVKLEMVYFRDANGNPETVQTIPNNWIRMQDHDGIVRLIPNARFPASLQVDGSGNFFPEVLRSNMVPNLWRITYNAGFEDGKIPNIVNQAIGLLAAIQAMILGGIQVFGPGIASKSISLDGLSQSISTTVNAEHAAYGPVIAEYKTILYGQNKDDKNGLLEVLRYYYKGEMMGVL